MRSEAAEASVGLNGLSHAPELVFELETNLENVECHHCCSSLPPYFLGPGMFGVPLSLL